MNCERCNGLVVQDQCLDLLFSGGEHSLWSWRCVSCGNVVDPMVLHNRRRQKDAVIEPTLTPA